MLLETTVRTIAARSVDGPASSAAADTDHSSMYGQNSYNRLNWRFLAPAGRSRVHLPTSGLSSESAMSNDGAALGAAVPVPMPVPQPAAGAAPSRAGRRRPVGKARSAQNALRHGMRALQYVVLPEEDAVQYQTLEAALLDELAPEGALQLVLARRVAVAAWRLARADRMEVELFEERRWEDAGVGMALIRDGNGTRSFETLCATAAPPWPSSGGRSRRSALQAGQASVLDQAAGADLAGAARHPACRAAPVRARPPRLAARRAPRRSPRTERTRAPHGLPCCRSASPALPCTSPRRRPRRTNPSADCAAPTS